MTADMLGAIPNTSFWSE